MMFALVCAGVVMNVIVAEQSYVDSRPPKDPACKYIETVDDIAGGRPRASKGDEYHEAEKAFTKKKPHASWRLDRQKMEYVPPVGKDRPTLKDDDLKEPTWDEAGQRWKLEKKK